ncbi:hypothetical protein ACFQ60_37980 [Streptomyces zhihengii]
MLRISGDEERLTAALAALAAAYPAAAGGAEEEGTPAARLAGLLGVLGLRVRPRLDPELGEAAVLEWEAGGATRTAPLVGDDPEGAPALLSAALGTLFTAGPTSAWTRCGHRGPGSPATCRPTRSSAGGSGSRSRSPGRAARAPPRPRSTSAARPTRRTARPCAPICSPS